MHTGPAGQPYYYHAGTRESTYVRPLPAFPIIPQAIIPQPPKKKDKPLVKTPIPGTEWLRVTTTEGNVFYSHKAKKQSLWTVPDEIKDAVEAFEHAEKHVDVQEQQQETREKDVEKLGLEEEQELKRIKTEIQGLVKRKAEEPQLLDEVVISKKARVEEEEEEEEGEAADEADDDEEGEDDDESEEEEWQREAAAQLAAEAEEEKKRLEEEARLAQEAEDAEIKKMQENERSQLNMPNRVDLSIEEAKALFKVCH
jgi:heat shock protein beta